MFVTLINKYTDWMPRKIFAFNSIFSLFSVKAPVFIELLSFTFLAVILLRVCLLFLLHLGKEKVG